MGSTCNGRYTIHACSASDNHLASCIEDKLDGAEPKTLTWVIGPAMLLLPYKVRGLSPRRMPLNQTAASKAVAFVGGAGARQVWAVVVGVMKVAERVVADRVVVERVVEERVAEERVGERVVAERVVERVVAERVVEVVGTSLGVEVRTWVGAAGGELVVVRAVVKVL